MATNAEIEVTDSEGICKDLDICLADISDLRRGIEQRDKIIDELRQKLGWTEGQMYLFTDSFIRPENIN